MDLLKAVYNNMFCYEYIELPFHKLKHVSIFGENGTGKSYLFDSIYLILFGEVPRKKYTSVLRDLPEKKGTGYGILWFRVDKKIYKVKRVFGKGKKVMIWENKKLKTYKTISIANNRIKDIIGVNKKVFMNVAYFSQNDTGRFLKADSSERIRILSDILDMAIFDNILKSVGKDAGSLSLEVENYKGQLESFKYLREFDVDSFKQKRKMCDESLKYFESKLVDYSNIIAHIVEMKGLKNEFENNDLRFESDITRNKVELKSLIEKKGDISLEKKRLKEIESKLANKNFEQIGEFELKVKKIDKLIIKCEKELSVLGEKVDKKNLSISKLEKIGNLKNKECPVCKKKITKDNVEDYKKHIVNLNDRISLLQIKMAHISSKIEALNIEKVKCEFELNKINLLKSEFDKLKGEKKSIEGKLNKLPKLKIRIANKRSKIKKVKSKRAKAEKVFKKKLQKYYEPYLNMEENEQRNKLSEISEKMSKIQLKRERYHYEIEKYYKDAKAKTKIIKNIKEVSLKNKIISYWKENLPSIKLELLKESIPFIEAESNRVLSQLLPNFKLKFVLDPNKLSNKLDIVITDYGNNRIRNLEGWSGGQKDKMAISIYMAFNKLAKMKSGVNLNFLLLDEKFSSIDSKSHDLLIDVIKAEQKDRKIFSISHIENITNKFDQRIEVVKVDGVTKIKLLAA